MIYSESVSFIHSIQAHAFVYLFIFQCVAELFGVDHLGVKMERYSRICLNCGRYMCVFFFHGFGFIPRKPFIGGKKNLTIVFIFVENLQKKKLLTF